jgi:hypothetical protein
MTVMTNRINRLVVTLVATTALSLVALSSVTSAQTVPVPAPAETPSATKPAAPAPMGAPAAVSSPEDCLKAAFDIAQTAEDKKLADDQLSKIEDLLTKMESHCDAKQFSEAASVGTDLKALIQKQ